MQSPKWLHWLKINYTSPTSKYRPEGQKEGWSWKITWIVRTKHPWEQRQPLFTTLQDSPSSHSAIQPQHYLSPPAAPVLLMSWSHSDAPYGVMGIQNNTSLTKLLVKHQYTACTETWEVAANRAQTREGMCASLSAARKIVRRYSWKEKGRESWREKKSSDEESITAVDKSFRNTTKVVFLYLLTIHSYKSKSTALSKSLRVFQLTSMGTAFQLDGDEGKVRH